MTIGKELKELRKKKYMSIDDLHIKSGVAKGTIYRIENDENYSIETLIKLFKTLDRQVVISTKRLVKR